MKVLIVEEDTAILTVLHMYLRRRYAILLASSGSAAIQTLQRHPDVSIVFLDLQIGIYKIICQDFPNTVVLLTSPNPRNITSLARLCDNFLAKPYDINTLTYYLDQLDVGSTTNRP